MYIFIDIHMYDVCVCARLYVYVFFLIISIPLYSNTSFLVDIFICFKILTWVVEPLRDDIGYSIMI